jgi:hypothetical protein
VYQGVCFNSVSHLAGAVLDLSAGPVVVAISDAAGGPIRIASLSVIGLTLFLLCPFSTLCRGLRGPAKRIFQALPGSEGARQLAEASLGMEDGFAIHRLLRRAFGRIAACSGSN